MAASDVRILIFKLILLSYLISDFDRVCGRLDGLIRACMSDSHAYKAAVPFVYHKCILSMSLEWSIVHFKGSQIRILKSSC